MFKGGEQLILGIGLDIIETARVESKIENQRFLDRVYTPSEQKYILARKRNGHSAAGIFAAKEAVAKALGTGFGTVRWTEIEIIQDPKGKPCVNLSGAAQQRLEKMGGKHVLVSITHIKDLAAAQAVIDSEAPKK
ncbi:MAG TPA: holo-[acyl-carrier-protein] synthase [Clostridiales bacterium]|nr:holo-[acyl-carrier-protein] synthase [Clostridiales bacterium]